MNALVHAEVMKVRATRSWVVLLAAPVVYPLAMVALLVLVPVENSSLPGPEEMARGVADVARFVALLVGILAAAGEHRHGTVVASLLAVPRRSRYLAAKLASQAAIAATMAATMLLVTLGAGWVYLRSEQERVDLASGDLGTVLAGAVVTTVFYAVAGTALGAIVRNQAAAIAGALLWVLAVEQAVPIVLRDPGLRRWLPGGAADRLLHPDGLPSVLPSAWAAVGVLVAVAAGLVAAALAITVRADVDGAGG